MATTAEVFLCCATRTALSRQCCCGELLIVEVFLVPFSYHRLVCLFDLQFYNLPQHLLARMGFASVRLVSQHWFCQSTVLRTSGYAAAADGSSVSCIKSTSFRSPFPGASRLSPRQLHEEPSSHQEEMKVTELPNAFSQSWQQHGVCQSRLRWKRPLRLSTS